MSNLIDARARLYVVNPSARVRRTYRVVVRGQQVGEVSRYRRGFAGKMSPWRAIARLSDGTVLLRSYIVRRGDAVRWVLTNQTVVLS